MADATVIIVSWNSRDDLRNCLRSLQESSQPTSMKVVVVDNASSDGSAGMVEQEFPAVRVRRSGSNLGFAAANNVAMRESDTRYVILLNPDTEVLGPGLRPLVDFMDRNANVWAAGPALLNSDRTPQRSGVRFPSVWNIVVETLFLDRVFPRWKIFGQHRELYAAKGVARRVDYVQGSCLIVRREPVFTAVGLIDEEFFMYFEETDWCFRMQRAGGEVWVCPDARVVHHGGGTVGHYDERRILHYHKSLFRFIKKNSGDGKAMLVRCVILLRSLVRLVVWGVVAIVRPTLRSAAFSALRGYGGVLRLCVTPSAITRIE